MAAKNTYRRQLFQRAVHQYGFITSRDARALGIPTVELRKLAQRGGLRNQAYGLYRFDDIPVTAIDNYMGAVLLVGPTAFLMGESVLALHGLARVMPRRFWVGTPRRVRSKLPPAVAVVHQKLEADERTMYEGIPSATVARALLDCSGIVRRDYLIEGFEEARRQGLVSGNEVGWVAAALGVELEDGEIRLR